MYEELKLDLQGRHDGGMNAHGYDLVLHIKALKAIEQLERQLAERDAEIAKYRDAPIVAWRYWQKDNGKFLPAHFEYVSVEQYSSWAKDVDGIEPLIVKPGEQ